MKSNLTGLAHGWGRLGAGVKGGVRELLVPEKVDWFGREGLIPEQFKINIWAGKKLNKISSEISFNAIKAFYFN